MVSALIFVFAATAYAQRRGGFGGFRGGGGSNAPILPNEPYDGKFTFIRLRYGPADPVSDAARRLVARLPGAASSNLMKIMDELTYLGPHTDQSNVLALDDPELFKYPVAYMSEPGFWYDDRPRGADVSRVPAEGRLPHRRRFPRSSIGSNFEEQMRRVLPDAQFFDIDGVEPGVSRRLLLDRVVRLIPQYYDPGSPDFPRHLRGQRSEQAADGDHQLQHRHVGVLGILGHRA